MRRLFGRFLYVLIAGALIGMASPSANVLAQGGARVVFSPAQARVGDGQTGAVALRVESVQDLYGLDIRVSFDPAVVEVVDADAASAGVQVRAGDLLSLDFMIRNTVDNVQGTITFAMTQVNPSPPVTGSGVVFTVLFRGKTLGAASPLTITYQKMATRGGEVIAATAENGEIRVVDTGQAPPTPTMAPPPSQPTVVTPTALPTAAQATSRPTVPSGTSGSSPTPPPAQAATTTRSTPVGETAAPMSTATGTAPAGPAVTPTASAAAAGVGGFSLGGVLGGMGGVVLVTLLAVIAWVVLRRRRPTE
jgi:hypothetical protein